MPARNRIGLSENTRERIKTAMIVKRLVDHIDGKIELKQTQIRAAEILLRKVLPDIQAISHDVTGTITHAAELTDGVLLAYLTQQRALVAQSPAIPADYAVIAHKPTDTIPAECHSDAPQCATRHDTAETNTNVAGKPRKQRTRAYKAPKVDI